MKKLLFLLAAVLIVSGSQAQQTSEKNVPAAVKAAFQKQYPQVKKVSWDKEQTNYEAGFKLNDVSHSVLIDASGKILETEAEIGVEALPAVVKAYVTKNYPGQKIKEAAKITDAKGVTTYEAEIKGKDLIFDSKGNFVKEVKP